MPTRSIGSLRDELEAMRPESVYEMLPPRAQRKIDAAMVEWVRDRWGTDFDAVVEHVIELHRQPTYSLELSDLFDTLVRDAVHMHEGELLAQL